MIAQELLIDAWDRSPKFIMDNEWKSNDYRQWIAKNYKCYCYNQLSPDGSGLHHHLNTGGLKPRDQLLTRFCDQCHKMIHNSAKSKNALYIALELNDERIIADCSRMLLEYLIETKGVYLGLNALSVLIK